MNSKHAQLIKSVRELFEANRKEYAAKRISDILATSLVQEGKS